MTAAAANINHLVPDGILAAGTWGRMEKEAFPSSSDTGVQRDTRSSSNQPDFLSFGERDQSSEQNDTNFFNAFQGASIPSTWKSRRLLTGESTASCTPWRTKDYTCDPPGLHDEICDFCEYMKPRPSEMRMRQEVIWRVSTIIRSKWPQARIDVFGSFVTSLFLPSSDIDLVVFGSWAKLPLFSLEEEFKRADIAIEGSILVLDKTTVPIIKFIDKRTEVKVDISFNHDSGLKCAKVIQKFMQQYPVLSKLVLILKQFLTQRQLNEVYYGGISSYSIILLLVSFLQLHPRHAATEANANLGVLLIEFFELYGRHFNYMKTGIRVLDGGSYFTKGEEVQDLLYIQDPVNHKENASRGCFGMWQVKQAFDHAFLKLHSTVISRDNPVPRKESLLSSIIKVSQEVVEYRSWVDSTWPMPPLSSPPTTPTIPLLMIPVLPSAASHYYQQFPLPPFQYTPTPHSTETTSPLGHSTSAGPTSSSSRSSPPSDGQSFITSTSKAFQ